MAMDLVDKRVDVLAKMPEDVDKIGGKPRILPVVTLQDGLEDCDEDLAIDAEVERRLVRKIDRHILPWICVAYLCNYLDRANLGNAKTLSNDVPGASLSSRIDLGGTRYSTLVALFFVPYALMEAPSNFFLKRFTPSKWIARIMVSWGIVTACQAAVVNYAGLVACRLMLGLAEAGFYPGCIFYLTFWYRPEERGQRMAIFAASVAVSGAFSGLLATAISFLNGKGSLFAWQWLFILEAIPAVVVGVLAFFWMPDYPSTARFLTPEERRIAEARLGRHAPKGSDRTVDWRVLRATVVDVDFWLFAVAYFCMTNSLNAVGFFLPSLVASLGFSGWRGQAMTVPPNVFGAIIILVNAVWSDRRKERCVHALGGLVVVGVGYILLASTSSVAPRLVGVFFISATNAAVIPFLAFRLSTISGSTATAIASGATIAFANIGGITAPYLFKADEAPFYPTANYAIFAMQVLAALIILVLWYRLGSSALYRVKGCRAEEGGGRGGDSDGNGMSGKGTGQLAP
ncbi:uncharacterized protein PFL1_06698 [Pseudozyma flocculosa PF-1]|uniref:Major facilitator superfamily (MFS) profile domain-containing protein n=2 Tax=Pseudozyma flocculosa TaxID=84751 RepID=A0A061H0Y2_9BASI|nr:uncharacterized protein PFL1_06698 [Pseudozyma flocculosa PF-1]EPQ25704.1 hypothetical protein PFL1_06698 [Pseudozyma flocculosa PF-1]SPO38921.1 related to putative tartrate transporter [Pseudozyma flocculosa]